MIEIKKMIKLEEIGFYTLSDDRAKNISNISQMKRCEMILTDKCNFKCPYCRGLKILSEDCLDDIPLDTAKFVLNEWIEDGLENVRFSGGEPTLYPFLNDLVKMSKKGNVKRIAISTNGSNKLDVYKKLIDDGVNDFSVSLDACCSSFGDKMSGIKGFFNTVINNIEQLSKLTYVTVGIVVTPETVKTLKYVVSFAHALGVADIRIISSAQWNSLLDIINNNLDDNIINSHPILNYRINNIKNKRNVRGLSLSDCHKCHWVKDDSVVAGQWHFPCVIYMREGGKSIGKVNSNMRAERIKWFENHDSFSDPICLNNCLDVCIDFNNKVESFIQKSLDNYRFI